MTLSGRIPPAPEDDDDEWMVTFSTLADEEIDALLRGESASPVAGGLTNFMHELRADGVRHGAPPMNAMLRARIARPMPSAAPSRRRRLLAGGLGGLLLGGATMGVAAAQDVLPAPIQDVTASVAGAIGVDLPRSTERDAPADDGSEDGDGGSGRPTDTTTEASDPDPAGEGSTGTAHGDGPSSTPGPPDSTPGGAVPADPGTPGDKEPAIPAAPATGNGQSSGDNGEGNGNNASKTGQGTGKP